MKRNNGDRLAAIDYKNLHVDYLILIMTSHIEYFS